MKNSTLSICDATIHPGEIANLALPLPERYSCAPLYMPFKVIHGKFKGPCLLVFSTLYGNELNGLEIANRVVDQISPNDLHGTVITVPAVNIYGLTQYPRSLPSGEKLANCFPGDEQGTYGQRIAHLFTHELLKKANFCIELQTGGLNHNILPQVYCNFSNKQARELAKVFSAPVVTNVNLEGNQLRQTTEDLQIPLLVYQAGEALRFDENVITLGLEGVMNVLRAVEMLPKTSVSEITPIFSQEEDWIIAHSAGILRSTVSLGQIIKEKEVIATITDPFGNDYKEKVLAPREGIVVGINTTPLIHEGSQIFKITSFIDIERAETVIETWDKTQPDSFIETS